MAARALQDNLGRLRWLAIVVIALNLVHVLVFQVSGASPNPVVQGWKSGIVLAHLGMAGVMGALLLALRSAARARPGIRRLLHRAVEIAGCLGGMGFAILLVAIDQVITPSITPYLVASVLAGSLLLLRPWFALLLSMASGGAFWWAMGVAQADPVLRLTNRVNGVTTASIGLLLSVIFWRKFVSHETLVTELKASRAELLRHQVELEHQARHDGLTGLQTRLEFRRRTEHELALAQRHGQETSLILIDLDLFKRINDTWGHPVGDAVLVAVARALCNGVRSTDLVARLGGEEFIILLPCTLVDAAVVLAERLREQVLALDCAPVDWPISASFGVASLPGGLIGSVSEQHDLLYAAADSALYASKRLGRNRVELA